MKTLQIQRCARPFVITMLAAAVLIGCSISRKQPASENTNVAASATPAAQPTQAAKAKPTKHRLASEESSAKSGSKAILSQIYQANLREIALAKLANDKASTDEVRQYAAQLIADDTSANKSVVEVAQKINVQLPDTVATRHQSAYSKLSSAAGAEFDKQFLQQVSAEHDRLIATLKQEQQNTSNDDVEALIEKILPIFQQQQQLAQMLMKKEQA
jgi:putative membrane protein